jgi:hypothetical protein
MYVMIVLYNLLCTFLQLIYSRCLSRATISKHNFFINDDIQKFHCKSRQQTENRLQQTTEREDLGTACAEATTEKKETSYLRNLSQRVQKFPPVHG